MQKGMLRTLLSTRMHGFTESSCYCCEMPLGFAHGCALPTLLSVILVLYVIAEAEWTLHYGVASLPPKFTTHASEEWREEGCALQQAARNNKYEGNAHGWDLYRQEHDGELHWYGECERCGPYRTAACVPSSVFLSHPSKMTVDQCTVMLDFWNSLLDQYPSQDSPSPEGVPFRVMQRLLRCKEYISAAIQRLQQCKRVSSVRQRRRLHKDQGLESGMRASARSSLEAGGAAAAGEHHVVNNGNRSHDQWPMCLAACASQHTCVSLCWG